MIRLEYIVFSWFSHCHVLTMHSHYGYIDHYKIIYLVLNHMSTVTFDTLKFVEKLKAAGISDAQAKAESEALQGVLAEALDSQLATKNDLIKLDRRLDGLDAKIDRMDTRISGELTLLKWMMGIIIAGVMSIVIKTFFS